MAPLLRSGVETRGLVVLKGRGQYEQTLRQHGFRFTVKKIGPKNSDELGGVYVYVAWL